MMWTTTYVAMGSNLQNPEQQVATAVERIKELSFSREFQVSPAYRSKPLGPQDQPDFVNCVIRFETQLSPTTLLNELQAIEQKHNRVRDVQWGPRTLDLDILLYGAQRIRTDRLIIPHKELEKRIFVVQPLFDLDPELILPNGTSLKALKSRMRNDMTPIDLPGITNIGSDDAVKTV